MTTSAKDSPLVTVICLCYNHERFIEDCLRSVVKQTYPNLEIIVMDDSSTDNSWPMIQKLGKEDVFKGIICLQTKKNLGNTSAFNEALKHAKGKYIVDLSTDDIILPERIEKQVNYFEALPAHFGVIYSNADYIDEDGNFLFRKYSKSDVLPEGNIYRELIVRYFIPSPTMMIKKVVFDELKGYDQTLAFEDFDFWIRSARKWHYGYQSNPLTLIRKNNTSLSTGWYKKGDQQVMSNYLICKKIAVLNQSKHEEIALNDRIKYEQRQAALTGNFKESHLFYQLLKERKALTVFSTIFEIITRSKIDFSFIFNQYKTMLKKRQER